MDSTKSYVNEVLKACSKAISYKQYLDILDPMIMAPDSTNVQK